MADEKETALLAKIIDNVPSLVLITGILLLILAIAKGITYNNWFPIPDLESRIAAGILGIIFSSVGLLLWLRPPAIARGTTPTAHPRRDENDSAKTRRPPMAEENEPNLTSSDLDKELSETYRQMVSALTAAALEDKLELFDSDQNAFMRYREQHLVFLRSGAVENGTMTEKTAEHDRYEMNQLRIRQIKYSLDLLK